MKHAVLRSIVHNVADSLASGIGLMIDMYVIDVFGDASRSPGRSITVDFLAGSVVEGKGSRTLTKAMSLYREALRNLCSEAGGSVSELKEAKARYWSSALGRRFAITVKDATGRRSITEYGGIPGQRLKVLDRLGRLRPKASIR